MFLIVETIIDIGNLKFIGACDITYRCLWYWTEMRVYGNFTASGAGLHPETLKVPLILSAGGGLESRVKSSFQPKVQSGETGPRKSNWPWQNRVN